MATDGADPASFTTAADFSAGLRLLRERASLSIRDLARATGASSSTVGGYMSGRHLPTVGATPLVVRILEACGVTDETERDRWVEALNRLRRNPGPRVSEAPAPYKGLAGYDVEDAPWFCGREALTARLVALTEAAPDRPVLLVGPSGSGKSSILRAGLAATLAGRDWDVHITTPGGDPVAAVVNAAADAAGSVARGRCVLVVVDQLEELWTAGADEAARRDAVRRLADLASSTPDVAVATSLRADFYPHALASPTLAAALQSHQIVVGPMSRSDLVRAVTEPAARAGISVQDGLVDLLLRDITPHGRRADGEAYEAGALPLLSFALLQTWQQHQQRLTIDDYLRSGGIELAVAETAERVYAGLDDHGRELARRLFTRLVAVGEETADTRRRVGHEEIDGLEPDGAGPSSASNLGIADVVEEFVAARLLTAGETHVEITHEALLNAWPRLSGWLDDDRAGLALQRRLADDAAAWARDDRSPDRLLEGPRLDGIRAWADRSVNAPSMTALEREYLGASLARHAATRAARRRRARGLQLLAAGLAVALLAVAGLAGYTQHLRGQAERDRDLTLSRQLAEAANRLRATDPVVAARLAVLAYRTSATVEARSALLDAAALPLARRLDGPGGITSVATSGDGRLIAAIGADGGLRLWTRPSGAVTTRPPVRAATVPDAYADAKQRSLYAVAVEASGRYVAVGGLGGAIRVWDATDPFVPRAIARLDTDGLTVLGLAVGRGGLLAAALSDPAGTSPGRLGLWTLGPNQVSAVGRPAAVDGPAQSVAFDAAGAVVAVGTSAGVVHRYRVPTAPDGAPSEIGPALTGSEDAVTSIAFSPDGTHLAVGSKDLLTHVWTLKSADGAVVPVDPAKADTAERTLSGAQSWVNAVAFSPDGSTLVTGSSDSRTRIYDTTSFGLVAQVGNPGPVTATVFAPDGASFLTAGADGTVRQWPFPLPLSGIANGRTFAMSYVGKDRVLAMTSVDSARIVDVGTPFVSVPVTPNFGAPPASDGQVPEKLAGTLAVSGDGRRFAAGGRAGTTWLYDATSTAAGRAPSPTGTPVHRQTKLVEAAALTPDGGRLLTSSDDASLVLTDVSDPANPKPLGDKVMPGGVVYALTASPDGRFFASGTGTSGAVDIWRADGPTLTKVATAPTVGGPTLQVYGLSFTPDGRTLAVGAADRTVRFLDLSTPSAPRWTGATITGPGDYVFAVQFDAAGRRLAAASADGIVRVYDVPDVASPRPFAVLGAAAGSPLYSVALRPDGRQVSAGGGAEAINTWSLDPAAAAARICALRGDGPTPQEWARYVPSVPFADPCP